jgi:hypothetical protein
MMVSTRDQLGEFKIVTQVRKRRTNLNILNEDIMPWIESPKRNPLQRQSTPKSPVKQSPMHKFYSNNRLHHVEEHPSQLKARLDTLPDNEQSLSL